MQNSTREAFITSLFKSAPVKQKSFSPDYEKVEQLFDKLIEIEDLDRVAGECKEDVLEFERALDAAINSAYMPNTSSPGAHRFLQRVLYRINRLKFFWYDDLSHYTYERSEYLRLVRNRIETAWQKWEGSQLDTAALGDEDICEGLRARAAQDVAPEPSLDGLYFRNDAGRAGYKRLLAIASLDGLVEASQLSRTLGGVSNDIHAMMTRLHVEEYGGGRITRKHSSFFATMLSELGMHTEPEFYFNLVPWEVLANINHSFLLSERKRFYLRYVGGLLYTEVSVPAAFHNYRVAAERLGMSEAARGYWELHIREDERHGRWMLEDVALPLVKLYPNDAWELLLGYDQQKFFSARSGVAVTQSAREADREEVETIAAVGASA